MNRTLTALATAGAGLLAVVAAGVPAQSATTVTPLASPPRLRVTADYVTGISSGGYMATQLQVAHSATFKGAGIVSAGPYYCAQGSLVRALEACMVDTVDDDVPGLVRWTDDAARGGLIDPPANLATVPTWMFHGTADTTVYEKVSNDLATFYRHYGTPLTYSSDVPAGHGWISPLGPVACGETRTPFVNDCGIDAPGEMLAAMLGRVAAPNTGALKGRVVSFSQDPYAAPARPGAGDPTRTGAAAVGMGPEAYAYLPAGCEAGQQCRLVVALHGCQQTAAQIGTTFVETSYLNNYADTNKLVILYPQAQVDTTFGNPKGCWDWWGYLGPNDTGYATKAGPQVATVMNLVHALGG